MKSAVWALALLLASFFSTVRADVFYNPIISDGADPWVIFKDGFYHYTHTTGFNVRIRKAARITGTNGLANATAVTVFTPPAPFNQGVWAPELHFLQGKWYIYFAADDGDNANHRMYVAEANSTNTQGAYTLKGKITDATDRWAIDGTVLEKDDGSLYFIWSGWPGSVDGQQNLYIAPMSNPWTISGPRVRISTPTYSWEGWINEGPQIIKRNGKIFIVYSANASWTDEYCFGLLTNTDGDILNAASWTKTAAPIFKKYSDENGAVYGPGHGSFTKSIDQTEDWLFYHAAKSSGSGWDRNVRIQKFSWNADDSPRFGNPIPPSVALPVPSGEGTPLVPGDELILDNASATFSGEWTIGILATDKYGFDYRFAHTSNTVTQTATYIPMIPQTGRYDVYAWYSVGFNRSTNAPYTISSWDGAVTVNVNQQANGGGWRLLAAEKILTGGTNNFVRLSSNSGEPSRVVIADAIRFVFSTNQTMPSRFSSTRLANKRLFFNFHGTPGTTNVIESSTNLVNWSAFTNVVMSSNVTVLSDSATNGTRRFYRLKP